MAKMKSNVAKMLSAAFALGLTAACAEEAEWRVPPLSDQFNKTDRCIMIELDRVARAEHARTGSSVALPDSVSEAVFQYCIAREGQEPVSDSHVDPDGTYFDDNLVFDISYFKAKFIP